MYICIGSRKRSVSFSDTGMTINRDLLQATAAGSVGIRILYLFLSQTPVVTACSKAVHKSQR